MKLATSETIRTCRTCTRKRIVRLLNSYSDRTVISLLNERHFPHVQEVAQHLSRVSFHRRPLDLIAGLSLPRELEVKILVRGKRYDGEARRQLVF